MGVGGGHWGSVFCRNTLAWKTGGLAEQKGKGDTRAQSGTRRQKIQQFPLVCRI